MKIAYETSCGIVLWTPSQSNPNEAEFLLLHYPGGHWDFPKGHVEPMDSGKEATARRELQEETGITQVEIDPEFRTDLRYQFYRGAQEKVDKTVHFFVGKTEERAVRLSHEHQGSEWLPYSEALKRLTFENAKEILRDAYAFLIDANHVEC